MDLSAQIRYPYPTALLYDLQTGEQIHWTQLLLEGWRENAMDVRSEPFWEPAVIPDGELELLGLYPYEDGTLFVSFRHEGVEYNAEIPWNYVNYE